MLTHYIMGGIPVWVRARGFKRKSLPRIPSLISHAHLHLVRRVRVARISDEGSGVGCLMGMRMGRGCCSVARRVLNTERERANRCITVCARDCDEIAHGAVHLLHPSQPYWFTCAHCHSGICAHTHTVDGVCLSGSSCTQHQHATYITTIHDAQMRCADANDSSENILCASSRCWCRCMYHICGMGTGAKMGNGKIRLNCECWNRARKTMKISLQLCVLCVMCFLSDVNA